MKSKPRCLACTIRAAYDIAKRSTQKKELREKIVFRTMEWLEEKSSNYNEIPPSVLHTKASKIAKEITDNPDPFSNTKKVTNDRAQRALTPVENRIQKKKSFDEVFKIAVKSTICGNAIDFEVEEHDFDPKDIEPSLMNCLDKSLNIDQTEELQNLLSQSDKVVYLLDNAGEIVFDKKLIEIILDEYSCEIIAVVKEGPVLNDATLRDAEDVSLTGSTEVITTGDDYIGLHLESVSSEFLNHLKSADLIIAKGQGYYESLTETKLEAPICYILKAKCVEVAENLDTSVMGNVIRIE